MKRKRDGCSRLRHWIEDFKRGPLTVLVWCLAIGGICALFGHRARRCEYVAVARGIEYRISPSIGGRIDTVLVTLYDEVNAGDVVARLDGSLLAAQIETARSDVQAHRAELEAARAAIPVENDQLAADWQAKLADFAAREERYRTDSQDLKVTIEGDRIEARRLALEAGRMRKLRETNSVSQQEFETIELQAEQVAKRISENTALAARMDRNCEEARKRRDEYAVRKPATRDEDNVLAPLREAVREKELELEELLVQRDAMVLRAPAAGRVTQLVCQAGQAVRPGEWIMVIGERQANEVIAYVPEHDRAVLRQDAPVHIVRTGTTAMIAEATIRRVGESVELLPERLWRDPHRPEYGRCFVVSAPPEIAFAPGERMRVRPVHRGI